MPEVVSNIVPPLDVFTQRLAFVDDESLRINCALSLQYVIFLVGIRDVQKTGGTTVATGLHKDMVLHTASVIEACLHHCLKKCLESGRVGEDVMPTEVAYLNPKVIYKNEKITVVGAEQSKKRKKFAPHVQFQDLIRACKKARILDDQLEKDVDRVREERNRIHLASLNQVDDRWTNTDVSRVTNVANKVVKRIENVLLELSNPVA